MNQKTLLSGLAAALLVTTAACSSTAPTTNSTNAAATTNSTNRTTPPANTSTSNTAPTNSANSGAAAQQGKQDFTLVNQTGVEINAVYVSPHDKNDWEEDVLGQDTLANGASVDITFHRDEKAAMWDLRIEDDKGGYIEWENLNLLEISKATLRLKDGKATAEVE